MRRLLRLARSTCALPLLLAACAPGGSPSGSIDDSFREFTERRDTGYIGNQAFEFDVSVTATVEIPLPDLPADLLNDVAEQAVVDIDTANQIARRDLLDVASSQIKFARNELKSKGLLLNLERGNVTVERASADFERGVVLLTYRVIIETIVKQKDLDKEGITFEGLVGREFQATLPAYVDGLLQRTGNTCYTESPGTEAPPDDDLSEWTLFYYFDPQRVGCMLDDHELTIAQFRVESSSAAPPTVYPEYDQLAADGKITMVAIFGQITHGELKTYDSGFRFYNNFVRQLRDQGFTKDSELEQTLGERYVRTTGEGAGRLEWLVDVYNPRGFSDATPTDESTARFRTGMKDKDIVFYGGHAFYGSLSALDDRAAYTSGYQIVFMDACFTYQYYTKQVFKNKATDQDPTGFALADVVNNTEYGRSDQPALKLYRALFQGIEAHARSDAEVANYSWNRLVEYMNASAEDERTGEIFGASGVRTNRYTPHQ